MKSHMYDHIILISLDTLRSDCVASNPYQLWREKYDIGDIELQHSVLDELAKEGSFFLNCITAAPYTSSSHATIFTGEWPVQHGVYELFNKKLTKPTVFAEAKHHGYTCCYKTDFAIMLGPYLGLNRDADQYIVEDDDEYLASLTPDRKSFDFVHFGSMQMPYGFHNLKYGGDAYKAKVAALEARYPTSTSDSRDVIVETFRDDEDMDYMRRYKAVVQRCYADGAYDDLFSLYLEGVNHFLHTRFLKFVERVREQLRGTHYLIVIFGDHGHEYDRESYGHHNSISEGALRVPLIFIGDEVPKSRHTQRVRTLDIAPTIFDLLGVEPVLLDLQGESLLPQMLEPGDVHPDRQAFAQVYTTELSAYVEYQRKLLQAGQKVGDLPHVRFKEAVYEGPHRLTRQHYYYTRDSGVYGMERCDPPRTVLEKCHLDRYPTETADEDLKESLIALLDDYNSKLGDNYEAADHTETIHEKLRDLGYRV